MAQRENTPDITPDKRIIIYLISVGICVFLGPFGTYEDLTLWDRTAFWTLGICGVGWFMEFCINSLVDSKWLQRWHYLMCVAVGAVIGGLPGTSVVVAINTLFRPDHLEEISFVFMWSQVSLMAVLFTAFVWLFERKSPEMDPEGEIEQDPSTTTKPLDHPTPNAGNDESFEAPAQAEAAPKSGNVLHTSPLLCERLSHNLRLAKIISMSMQDHYVDVVTTAGSEMILMRLSDAIALLGEVEGTQIHRSHWVAKDFAVKMQKSGRRYEVTLSDGRSLPVSKKFAPDLEALLGKTE